MPESTPDRFATLRAPAHWQAVDFISDLHLQAAEPATLALWQHYLQHPPAQRADALFILGDLFEVWIGDDVLAPEASDTASFWHTCAQLLREYSRHTMVYFMHGNRDFLLGTRALDACGMQGLDDPTVLEFRGQRWLLSHGDALCLADTDYQQFRAVVRSADWQRDFLAKPLSEREAIARGLREQSEARKRGSAHDPSLWADVDAGAAREWLQVAGSQTLIHGHTHRPDQHDLGQGLRRVVLSDWDPTALPPRADVLRLRAQDGLQRLPLC
ncbi:UDP-2,3-diacylglucosamine diphosphatase [Hydrogenophaga sp. D2P1]|uniref:UDP-2,3-diacylglucosamine hydrolase n=1 Tax=Hydrogenophaga aromaticivorans TaxID=2610898 RepID=A0A7Y8GWH5_9BURK|nr:UDP-2,3-diacylglucosamine diphosphatase [Hydrogenophaga aromaticivorans]NWF45444.1 UDP-2,3-diacylglucosamine diphosphatase [Hydrogenophaga aromaticivorans]